jgi:hypothetical protein
MAGASCSTNRIPMRLKEFRSCEGLVRTHAAVCGIRTSCICQVKPLEGSYSINQTWVLQIPAEWLTKQIQQSDLSERDRFIEVAIYGCFGKVVRCRS